MRSALRARRLPANTLPPSDIRWSAEIIGAAISKRTSSVKTHILFVEVKSRMDTGFLSKYGRPGAAVDDRKKQHITECAREYIYKNKPTKKPRIDVIEVYLTLRDGRYVLSEKGIRHIENALC